MSFYTLLVVGVGLAGNPVATHPLSDYHAAPAGVVAPMLPANLRRPVGHLPHPPAGPDSGVNYRLGHSWGLMAGLHQVPAGRPLDAGTSQAVRSTFAQPGLSVSYLLSPTLRLVSGWRWGVGAYTVSPGNQFTVGISLR